MYRSVFVIMLIALVKSKLFANATETKETISNIFEGLGYSPTCVASALGSCEFSSNRNNLQSYLSSLTKKISSLEMLVKKIDLPKNCADIFSNGDVSSGVRTVYPFNCCRDRPVIVYCDQTTDGGGWTVFQTREDLPIREDFYRTWVEYVLGFGNVTGEYWLGLENIHALLNTNLMELRVDLEDFDGVKRWAKYGFFHVGDSASKYTVNIAGYSGDTGDAISGRSGMKFSTKDQDNDINGAASCAVSHRGAWWYGACHNANLNGHPYVGKHSSYADGINWNSFRGYNYSLKKVSMKIRPSFNR